MNKRVVIIAHLEKDAVVAETRKLVSYLTKKGHTAVLPENARNLIKARDRLEFTDDLTGDFGIVLGGDGTILRFIRTVKKKSMPILGVNFGKVGFLSEIEVDQLYKVLPQVLAGKIECEKRRLIEAKIYAKDDRVYRHLALNEVVVERQIFGRLIEMVVQIDGEVFNRYFADGLVVATPTGSTAYSFSAGGPVVSPGTSSILITPICTHSLFGRTVVLSDKETVTIHCPSAARSGVIISIDGWEIFGGDNFAKVDIRMSGISANLIKVGNRTYYDILREKLRVWDITPE